jgi:hypothetical protein
MAKRWPFRRSEHDHEIGSARGEKIKERQRHIVAVNIAWLLFEENRTVPWRDGSLSFSWLLNSSHDLVMLCRARAASAVTRCAVGDSSCC